VFCCGRKSLGQNYFDFGCVQVAHASLPRL
jgi:hypothetical protein